MNRMKPIDLDFYKGRSSAVNKAGIVLLLAGLVLTIYVVATFSKLNVEREKLKVSMSQLYGRQHLNGSHDNKNLGSEIQHAAAVIDRLAFPWDKLFGIVENSVDEDIAVLSIEPDIGNGVVVLSLEAKDWNAMLGYIKRLSKEKFFTDVHLVSHQVRQSDPQKPVRFVLSCAWM